MSVQKEVRKRKDGTTFTRYRAKTPAGSKSFLRERDARAYDEEIKRLRRFGSLADVLANLEAGKQTLDEYVATTWVATYAPRSRKTLKNYVSLYDCHISPTFGPMALRDIKTKGIARWQRDRLAAGAGPVAVDKALTLLGGILECAFSDGEIPNNPQRRVRREKLPNRSEVRPLAPYSVEKMRAASGPRDATLISVMAYAGLRPGEALGLRWRDVREQTLLVERAIKLGGDGDDDGTKTRAHRTVRLLAPLAADLREYRMRCGRPGDDELIFPARDGRPWTEGAYQSWRRRVFKRALTAAGLHEATPYHLRHSFASLLLHEGRSVIYVAKQLGHSARLTLKGYGHVIDELEDQPQVSAEEAIREARTRLFAAQLPHAAEG